MVITPSILVKATGCSTKNAELFAPVIQEIFQVYEINTLNRIVDFLAQVSHESGAFRYTKEIWGPTSAQKTYEGRVNLGNTQPGDGFRYLGRGMLQVTGRANYASLRDKLRLRLGNIVPDFELNPEELENPKWSAYAAGEYWDSRNCNKYSDLEDFVTLTKKINGGVNGLSDRKLKRQKALLALTLLFTSKDTSEVMPINLETKQPEIKKENKMSAFVGLAVEALMGVIPSLIDVFGGESKVAKRNSAAAVTVIEAAKKAVGAANEQELIEVIQAKEPAMVEALNTAVKSVWFEISTDNSGIEKARQADLDFTKNGVKFWQSPAFIVTSMIFALIGALLGDFLFVHPEAYSAELRTQIVTALIAFGSSGLAYWLGTSNSSQRKTELMSNQTKE